MTKVKIKPVVTNACFSKTAKEVAIYGIIPRICDYSNGSEIDRNEHFAADLNGQPGRKIGDQLGLWTEGHNHRTIHANLYISFF